MRKQNNYNDCIIYWSINEMIQWIETRKKKWLPCQKIIINRKEYELPWEWLLDKPTKNSSPDYKKELKIFRDHEKQFLKLINYYKWENLKI